MPAEVAGDDGFGLDDGASLTLDVLPVVGSFKSLGQLITGTDLVTGEPVNRWMEAVGIIAGIFPGGKGALKGVMIGAKIAKKGDKIKDVAKVVKKIPKKISSRLKFMGKTPGKKSKTGREVIDRMRKDGKIRGTGKKTKFKASDENWYPLKDADMAHKTDAVSWWNKTGRKHGAKSKEVRKWMLDSKNYELDHFSINRSQGAKLGETYKPPLK